MSSTEPAEEGEITEIKAPSEEVVPVQPTEKKKRLLSEKQKAALKLGQEKLKQKRLERKEKQVSVDKDEQVKITKSSETRDGVSKSDDSEEKQQRREEKIVASKLARQVSMQRSRLDQPQQKPLMSKNQFH